MKVVVYSKPSCVQCTATTRAMDAKGISYELVDLTQDNAAMNRVMHMGYRQAPVIIAGDSENLNWAGFQPTMIDRLQAEIFVVSDSDAGHSQMMAG
jgi:glutaredoxin-like protein NrdH